MRFNGEFTSLMATPAASLPPSLPPLTLYTLPISSLILLPPYFLSPSFVHLFLPYFISSLSFPIIVSLCLPPPYLFFISSASLLLAAYFLLRFPSYSIPHSILVFPHIFLIYVISDLSPFSYSFFIFFLYYCLPLPLISLSFIDTFTDPFSPWFLFLILYPFSFLSHDSFQLSLFFWIYLLSCLF